MHRILLAGLLPVFLAAPGTARESLAQAGDGPVVTEAEFLSALDDSHPAVAESSEALAVARARIVAARALENPVLGVEREDPDGPDRQMEWTLSWQLPGTSRRPEIAAREEAAGAVAARLEHQLLALRLTMKEVYSDWAFASARWQLLAVQARRVEALAERQRLRAERGESPELEARRLDLAAGGLRARLALAEAANLQARALAAGWSPALPPEARPALPELPAVSETPVDHPLVRAAEGDVAAAMLERQAAGRFVRSPELSLGWQRQETGPESAGGPVVAVAWSVPVFARGAAEKAAAEARLSGARARLEQVRREVESAQAGARASYQRLASAYDTAEAALGDHQRMLDGAEAAFRHGEASLTDLLETHRSVTEAELALLDLHQAALAAHRELSRTQPESNLQEDLP